ncbi:MAG: bifunctional DNA-formamidopyrimidine glycosylase/DNA-(apurinic or apyrimidinic site) lyase [Deltaproteobacteria bacterium]|nr:bifunctional DNA-formamidopyrimidine glycosylase/DNA-(apurinic or apyrimidinic site) lyase [Deltaproteobacteria bacterium]
MPELPEVESVVRQLAPRLRGRRLREVELLDPRLRRADFRPALGGTVERVIRIGKQVEIRLRETRGCGNIRLLCHLRMTGRLVWLARDETPRETRHLRARLRFDGGELLFIDPRRFGTLRFVPEGCEAPAAGLEPLSRACTPVRLSGLLARSRQELKPWLLRQDRLVGIGNIYASEIAFRARLHPRRTAGSLRPEEVRRLHQAVRSVLRRAIRFGGTTFSDFADVSGRSGRFYAMLAVYDREGRLCRRCRTPIVRFVQQQRSTYCCPRCQPLRRLGMLVASSRARETR